MDNIKIRQPLGPPKLPWSLVETRAWGVFRHRDKFTGIMASITFIYIYTYIHIYAYAYIMCKESLQDGHYLFHNHCSKPKYFGGQLFFVTTKKKIIFEALDV